MLLYNQVLTKASLHYSVFVTFEYVALKLVTSLLSQITKHYFFGTLLF